MNDVVFALAAVRDRLQAELDDVTSSLEALEEQVARYSAEAARFRDFYCSGAEQSEEARTDLTILAEFLSSELAQCEASLGHLLPSALTR